MFNCKGANFYGVICGLIVLGLGTVFLFVWHSGCAGLVQILSGSTPMQHNTALGFILSGAGLITFSCGKEDEARFPGYLVAFLGGITLAQYVFGIDIGIDRLYEGGDEFAEVAYPGRPSPDTAMCFSIVGMFLIIGGKNRYVMMGFAASVVVMAVLAFAGDFLKLESFSREGGGGFMAINTAFGFLVMGSGMARHGIQFCKDEWFDVWNFLPSSAAIVVFVLSFFSWYSLQNSISVRNIKNFEALVSQSQEAFVDSYGYYEQSLRGSIGLFYASSFVDKQEWKDYVGSLNIDESLSGINSMGYVDYVLEGDIDEYEDNIREKANSDFSVNYQGSYPDRFFARYMEPEKENEEIIGSDLAERIAFRHVAEKARDFGVPTLSSKMEFVRDGHKYNGLFLLLPVYEDTILYKSVHERRDAFKGLVYVSFVFADLMVDIEEVSKGQLVFAVYNGDKVNSRSLMYETYSGAGMNAREADYYLENHVDLAGQDWTVVWSSAEKYESPASYGIALVVAIFGSILALMLYFVLGMLVHKKEVVEREVKFRTEELNTVRDRLRLILNTIPDFVFVKNRDLEIVEANQSFIDISVEGESDFSSGNNDDLPGVFVVGDLEAFDNGFFASEERVKMPDGSKRLFTVTKVKFKDERGREFLLGIAKDITDETENRERMDVLKEVIIASAQASSFEELLKTVLTMICEYIKWPVGHAYIWNEEDGVLKPTSVWYLEEGRLDFSEFVKATEKANFVPGSGLPGRIFESGRPEWIQDISEDDNFPRNDILVDINLCSGFGLPVFLKGNVRVVLEFFSPDEIEADKELLRLWEAVGSQLSRLIEKKEAEEESLKYEEG